MALGQIVPLYCAAASAAMLFAAEGKYRWAALAAAASLVEPHLGLPLCIALALWMPASRAALAASAAALAVLGAAAMGIAQNIEYVTAVLPAHALSELTSDGQLSFSSILHAFGASDAGAIRGGTLSYAVMTAAGVSLGRLAAARFGNAAFLLAVPAATAAIGGSYLHGTDVVAAIPLVLLLLVHAPRYHALSLTALVLLAAPWWADWENTARLWPWFAFSAVATFYIVWQIERQRVALGAACALLIFAALLELSVAYNASRQAFLKTPHSVSVAIDEKYPEASWARISRETFSTQSPVVWFIRLPVWTGLALLVAGTALASRSHRRYATEC